MNGDEVRRLRFTRNGGYDGAAVDELLARVAAELDAGRPVAPLIDGAVFARQPIRLFRVGGPGGYDVTAVDWVLSQLRRQDDPVARDDPWRDLPVWGHYWLVRPDASAAELAEQAGRGAPVSGAAHLQAANDTAQEYTDGWRDFGLVPGTRLSLVKTGAARSELRTADQYALVSVRTAPARTFARDGRIYRQSRVKAAQWPAVAAEIGNEPPGSPAHLPRTEPAPQTGMKAAGRNDPVGKPPWLLASLTDRAGPPILYDGNRHGNRRAGGYVNFAGPRWLRFPVRGGHRSNAIMIAVDQAGQQVARYRIARKGALSAWRAIDITVHPGQQLTDELLLTLALTAPWISSFFVSEGGG